MFSHGNRCLLPFASYSYASCPQRGSTVAAETPSANPSPSSASAEAYKLEQLPRTRLAGHPGMHAAQKMPAQNSGQETAPKVSEPLAAPVSFDDMLLTFHASV